jgi:hypothetical protein|tara:strand:- start:228 stop:929 length:702 start_codon:yes stop_codon:yes gene_type:complete
MGLVKDDLKFLVDSIIEIDSYKSKMGEDQDIVTLAFSVTGQEPAKDLENFVEKGYPFVLDADVSSGEQPDGTYKVFVELERSKDVPMQILELADGVTKLSDLEGFRFRYHKNFKSKDLNNENIAETIPFDSDSYVARIKETNLENYKNYFTNSYAESVEMKDDVLTVKNTYSQPVSFKVMDFGKDIDIKESINMEDMAEVIWLTKYLGDYNINKYGKDLVLENQGYVLKIRRI